MGATADVRAEVPDDLAWGAFSDDPPWVVDLGAITWRASVPALRARARDEVPMLTTPGVKMETPGVPDETERVNLIAYLRTLSDKPIPLP